MVGSYFGGTEGHLSTIDFDIDKGERIIAALGRTDTSVRELTFFTNLGRVYGPYGGYAGDTFRLWSCHVRGIHRIYILATSLMPSVSILHYCNPVDKDCT